MRTLPHISDAELELMLLLWKNRDSDGYRPVSTTEIMERLGNGWSVSTVFWWVFLSKLVFWQLLRRALFSASVMV